MRPPRSFPTAWLALLMLLCDAATGFGDDWPMLGRDNTRNPLSPEKNPPLWWAASDRPEARKNIKWIAALGTWTKGDPVVAGGLVWIGTNNGAPRDPKVKTPAPVLMCFRERDGQFLYQYVTQRPKIDDYWEPQHSGHTSSPLAEGDRLWFTTMAAETICLDIGPLRRGSGPPRELWKVDMRKDLGVIPAGMTMGFARTCSIGAPYKDKIYVKVCHETLGGDTVRRPGDRAVRGWRRWTDDSRRRKAPLSTSAVPALSKMTRVELVNFAQLRAKTREQGSGTRITQNAGDGANF